MKYNKYKPYIRRRHNKDYYKIGFSIVRVPIVFKYVLVQSKSRHRVILAADSRTQLIKFVEDAVSNYKEWVKLSKLKRKLVDPGTLIPNFNKAVLNIMSSFTKHPVFTDYKILCNDPVVELNIPYAYKPDFKVNEILKHDTIEFVYPPSIEGYEEYEAFMKENEEKMCKLLGVTSEFLQEDHSMKGMSNALKILKLRGI